MVCIEVYSNHRDWSLLLGGVQVEAEACEYEKITICMHSRVD